MTSAPGPYALESKRGEVNELRQLLRNPTVQRDEAKKRDVIKKVIAFMTMGVDVSRLFGEMVLASNTKDLVQKKMVYLYLCTYAEQKADLAIMAINTLHKDARDQDPTVRGLALRSLCSLRLPNMPDFVLQPIRQRLNDPHPYVRRTAVMGVAKLYARHPQVVKQSDLVDVLYNMLRDKDTQVVSCVVQALNEILADEGGMAINAQIVLHLLNHLHEFNEWGQCVVMDVVAKYKPPREQEVFDIMNLLDDRLRHANAAVVMGVTKVYLNLTRHMPQLHAQVVQRLETPLLTLMSSNSIELSYAVLSHIALLVERAPKVFEAQYKAFFCQYNDSAAVKRLKISVLERLLSERNFLDIIAELNEYVMDADNEVGRRAIRGIGAAALRLDAGVEASIEALLGLVNLGADYVTAEACIVMKDILRKHPERYEDVIPSMQKALKSIDDEEGKIAVIWMIGEYGDTIRDAPYILESLIDNFDAEPSPRVRVELLSTAMKLFFKRPPELKAMLGRVLAAATKPSMHVAVRDLALLYYRLLRHDVHEAARVVNSEKVIVQNFTEAEDKEQREQLLAEFNSLSVVYEKPEKLFVTGVVFDEEEERRALAAQQSEEGNKEQLLAANEERDAGDDDAAHAAAAGSSANTAPASAASAAAHADLLPVDLFEATASGGSTLAAPALRLRAAPALQPKAFQQSWGALPVAATANLAAPNARAAQARLETELAARHVLTMASGTVGQHLKLYLYAQAAESATLYLVEAILDLVAGQLSLTVKTDAGAEAANEVVALVRKTLESLR